MDIMFKLMVGIVCLWFTFLMIAWLRMIFMEAMYAIDWDDIKSVFKLRKGK